MKNWHSHLQWLGLAGLLLVLCGMLGAFACHLNSRLYTHQEPFYDSLSYNEKLFRVMTVAQEQSIGEAIERACFRNATNCLPFVIAAMLAPILEPTRFVGVWIQTGLLWLFLSSLGYYFIRVQRFSMLYALLGCAPFLLAKCLYFDNGGLSDFRMDLSLYLGFGLTGVWYFIAVGKPSRGHFLMLGLAAATCCLCRATAPVYLLFGFGPLAVWELIFAKGPKERKRTLAVGFAIATVVVVVLAGWFYVLNFSHLKYYYVDWNTDANAKLPWGEAFRHVEMAFRILGEPLVFTMLIWAATTLGQSFRSVNSNVEIEGDENSGEQAGRRAIPSFFQEGDWQFAWLAAAPVLLMILRRAGLNPFVCMPTVFGATMVLALPCLRRMATLRNQQLERFVVILLLVAIGISVVRAWKRHGPDGQPTIAVHHQLMDRMVELAKDSGDEAVKFGVAQISNFDTNSFYSTMLFDRPEAVRALDGVTIDGVKLQKWTTFTYPAEADWQRISGATDQEKLTALLSDANRNIEFLIVPDHETASRLEVEKSYNFINRFLNLIRQEIVEDPNWIIVDSVQTGDERLELYRNGR